MARRLGWSTEDFCVIPNGVAIPEPLPRDARPSIGYLARFVPGKGIGHLVEAFILVHREMPEVRLRCAGSMTDGDAKYVETLKARLREAGCADAVEWLPNVSLAEKQAFLAGVTVFSVPATYSEAFGMYVIEALAAGTPVVLPELSAFPEIVKESGGGVLFSPGENERAFAANLAAALTTLLRDPEKGRALGEAGRAAVMREFSMTRLAERLVDLTASRAPL
jgi:glycosyltransferase involved in cell wall biosynthesis